MEKIFNGAAAPKRYESPALSVIDVNVERCFASGGERSNSINDMEYWDEWEEIVLNGMK